MTVEAIRRAKLQSSRHHQQTNSSGEYNLQRNFETKYSNFQVPGNLSVIEYSGRPMTC